MSEVGYTRFHPKWYRRRMPIFWWLRKASYTRFILRELTSVAVAFSALLLLAEVAALRRGPEAHERFAAWLGHPVALGVQGLVLAALLYHTVTWLHLAPKALVLRIGGRRIPDAAVIALHYLAWAAASAGVVWLVVGA